MGGGIGALRFNGRYYQNCPERAVVNDLCMCILLNYMVERFYIKCFSTRVLPDGQISAYMR